MQCNAIECNGMQCNACLYEPCGSAPTVRAVTPQLVAVRGDLGNFCAGTNMRVCAASSRLLGRRPLQPGPARPGQREGPADVHCTVSTRVGRASAELRQGLSHARQVLHDDGRAGRPVRARQRTTYRAQHAIRNTQHAELRCVPLRPRRFGGGDEQLHMANARPPRDNPGGRSATRRQHYAGAGRHVAACM